MGYLPSSRVEENDIFDALLQIKWRADLGIFLLVILAQNFQNRFRDFFKSLILIRRLFTKDRNIRTLEGAIWKLDISVKQLEATTITLGRSFDGNEDAAHRLWCRGPGKASQVGIPPVISNLTPASSAISTSSSKVTGLVSV